MVYHIIPKGTWDGLESKDALADRYRPCETADGSYVILSYFSNINIPGITPLSFADFKAWKAQHPEVFDPGLPVGIAPVFTVEA